MWFRKPNIQLDKGSSSFVLFQEALKQYDVIISADDVDRNLKSLDMDDIDFLEAIQLVEDFANCQIDRKILQPQTSVGEVVAAFDVSRKCY